MNTTNPRRDQSAEDGGKNDPDLRDRSAIQPGINTVSDNDYEEANEKLTKTAADDFRTEDDYDPNADRSYDEVNEE